MRLRLFFFSLLLGLSLLGCRKTEVAAPDLGYLPPFALPDSVALLYGQPLELGLPAEYQQRSDVTLALSFAGNPRLKVNAADSLATQLGRAITVSQATRRVHIDAAQLYPSSTTSDAAGVRTPRTYLATLTATSSQGYKAVHSTMKIKILPAMLGIAGLPATDPIPYGYGLYSALPLRYTVEYGALNPAGTELRLHINGRPDGYISLGNRDVLVAAGAGDPAQKYEWTYDLVPELYKDGYRVAYRQFRVVLLPQPRYFYGTYYPDRDLTVLTNYLVIQLGQPYMSSPPTFYPEKYRGSFSLLSISKDSQPFADSTHIFGVEATTGRVTVAPNTTLTEGTYKLTIRTQATTGLQQDTDLTLKMEQ